MNSVVAKKINYFLIGIMFVILAFRWGDLPPEIPLFYSRPWGQEQLGQKVYIFLFPAVSLAILLLNLFFIKLFLKENKFLSDIAHLSSLATTTLCLISLLKIISLVT